MDLEFLLEVLVNEIPGPKEDHEAYYLAIEMVKEEIARQKRSA